MAFCKRGLPKIKKILNMVDNLAFKHSDIALGVVKELASIIGHPTVDIIVKITKNQTDDLIREKVIKGLEYAIGALEIVDACKEVEGLENKAACFIKQLEVFAPSVREAMLIKLAQLLTREIDDARFKQSVYDAIVQGTFTSKKFD